MKIENLRSPHDSVGGLVYFGRMLDKIRLHAQGRLPSGWVENLGGGFDLRCCQFLRISYEKLREKVVQEPFTTDEPLLHWCYENGRTADSGDIDLWNAFMTKRGWRDDAHERLIFRLHEAGFPQDGTIETMFDYIDADEERPLRKWDAK